MEDNNSEYFCQLLDGHQSDVNWVDFNGHSKLVSCSNDRTVRLWTLDPETGLFVPDKLESLNGHSYGVNCVRYSPFGTIIASASTDGCIILWNSQTGEEVVKLQHDSGCAIRVCCFSPSSALLASGSDDELLVVWDISTRRKIKTLSKHDAKITGCSFTPDSMYLVSCSSSGDLKLWDTKYGDARYVLTYETAHDLGVLGCDFSSQYEVNVADGPLQSFYLLASCGNDDLVNLWHVRAGLKCAINLSHHLVGHSANVNCCKFSMNGTLLASAGGDKVVIIWDPRSGNMLHRLEGHKAYVTSCAFSDDGQLLATGSNDQTVIVWNLSKIKDKDVNIDDGQKPARRPSKVYRGSRKFAGKPLDKWTVDDVTEWLSSLQLETYADTFRTNHINGVELGHLTNDSLLTKLNIEPLGVRNRLLRSIVTVRNPLWKQIADDEQNNVRKPSEFCCPITKEIMIDPVLAADGHTYEREAIEKWIFEGNSTSPMTNEILINQTLTANLNLKSLIRKFQSNFGSSS